MTAATFGNIKQRIIATRHVNMEVELKNVEKQAGGQPCIHPTSLKLKSGMFNVLLGKTLAGKTTLLRLMAGLEKPTAGEIWFDRKNVTAVSVQRRNIAMVYQQFINYPNWRVYDNIASPLRAAHGARYSNTQLRQRIHDVCELLKLTPWLQRYPHELSGGQQQRVALARALVKQAGLILLDEPLANLDYKLREELREELPGLFADSGTTVVYATTEPTEALLLGGYTAALHEGNVSQYGTTHEVFKNPANQISASTFSDPPLNCANLEKKAGRFWIDQDLHWPVYSEYQQLADGPYQLGFRPHQLSLKATSPDSIRLDCRITISEINGSESLLHFTVNDYQWVSQLHGIHKLQPGTIAQLYLNPQQCFLFDSSGNKVIG